MDETTQALEELVAEGKMEKRVNPETGGDEYRLTDDGWAEARDLVEELGRPETPSEEYARLWGWDPEIGRQRTLAAIRRKRGEDAPAPAERSAPSGEGA